jgi:hypothetical protein
VRNSKIVSGGNVDGPMKRLLFFAAAVAICVLSPCLASAQTTGATIVVLPTSTIQFAASSDHNTQFAGAPVLTSYKLVYCLKADQAQCPLTLDLGKPVPDANNTITAGTVFGTIAPNTEYVAKVIAVGPGGETPTPFTDPFGVPGPPAVPGNPVVKK